MKTLLWTLLGLLVLLAAVAIVARTKAPTGVRAVRSPATPDEDSAFVPMAAEVYLYPPTLTPDDLARLARAWRN